MFFDWKVKVYIWRIKLLPGEKKKKKNLKLSININFLSLNDFIIYFTFITSYQNMFFFKIVCVINFFIKIALEIPVFVFAYFKNIAVQ